MEEELRRANEQLSEKVAALTDALAEAERRAMSAEQIATDPESGRSRRRGTLKEKLAGISRRPVLWILRAERARLQALMDQAPSGVVIAEAPSGKLIVRNDLAQRLMGLRVSSGNALQDFGQIQVFHSDGRPYRLEDWPLARALHHGEVVIGEEMRISGADGTRRTLRANAIPMRDNDGRTIVGVLSFDDITERKRMEDAARFLAEASGVLASSLDYRATLERVARLALPGFADYCLIDLVERDGQIRRVAAAHADPEKQSLVEELYRYPPDMGMQRGVPEVLRTGQPLVVGEASDSLLDTFVRDAEHLRIVRELGARSSLTVPLVARGVTLGAMTFVFSQSDRRYNPEDLDLARELSRRAGTAIDNARLYRELQEEAAERKQAEERSARLASFPEYNPNPVVEVDLAGSVTYANPMALRLFPDLAAAGRRHSFLEGLDAIAVKLHKKGGGYLERVVSCDGVFYHQVMYYVSESKSLRLYTFDITERKRVEERLARQRRVLDAIFDNILAHVAYLDKDFNFVRVNATYARGSGHPVEDLIGRNHFDLFPNEDNQRIFERVRNTGEPYVAWAKPFEFVDQPERGVTYWDWWLRPIRSPEGETEGVVLSLVDVTATERARREVERLNAELNEANAAKDIFVNILSHELRNPLSPILAGVEILRRSIPEDERIQRTLAIIERNARLQTRLVNDLLDLSRIARGKLHFQRAPVALDTVVRDAVHSQQNDAESACLSLHVEAPSGIWVLGDFDRLQQVVVNLLSNAIKFTPVEGEIQVSVRQADGMGRIIVKDNGIGIARDLLPELFTMFRQGEVTGQRQPGLGIGLSLVKSIAEMHGGKVWAESEGPGEGSRFTVELPLIPGPEGVLPGEQEEKEPGKILAVLIEDNPDTRALLTESLGLLGYEVRAAGRAEEALGLLRQIVPDVILADIRLPGLDGYEFLRRARAMPGLADVPAFAITGYGTEDDVRRARDAGYDGHFVKPVDVVVLDARVRVWVRIARERQRS